MLNNEVASFYGLYYIGEQRIYLTLKGPCMKMVKEYGIVFVKNSGENPRHCMPKVIYNKIIVVF